MANKENRPKTGTEKTLLILIAVLAALIVGFLAFAAKLLFFSHPEEAAAPSPTVLPGQSVLTMPEDRLPQGLSIGQKAPAAAFQDEAGKEISLSSLLSPQDQGLWLLFFASWCPDCDQQFEIIREAETLADRYGVRLILVDRLNRDKESVEAAKQKIAAVGAAAPVVYDGDEKVYKAWGFREIPSSAVLDREGRVLGYFAGTATAGECEGLLKRALLGRDRVGLDYISAHLSNGRGGVYTSSIRTGGAPTGQDVLSESQGLMLQYALMKGDRALFDGTLAYVQTAMMENGLTAWYVSQGKKAAVNAALDLYNNVIGGQ